MASHDQRPLQEAEGAFVLCGFLMALATHQLGRTSEAVGWFERNRTACGPGNRQRGRSRIHPGR